MTMFSMLWKCVGNSFQESYNDVFELDDQITERLRVDISPGASEGV